MNLKLESGVTVLDCSATMAGQMVLFLYWHLKTIALLKTGLNENIHFLFIDTCEQPSLPLILNELVHTTESRWPNKYKTERTNF